MKSYCVSWEIEVDADSPQDAAKLAWDLMRGANSTANVFTVCDDEGEVTRVDLQAEDEEREV